MPDRTRSSAWLDFDSESFAKALGLVPGFTPFTSPNPWRRRTGNASSFRIRAFQDLRARFFASAAAESVLLKSAPLCRGLRNFRRRIDYAAVEERTRLEEK